MSWVEDISCFLSPLGELFANYQDLEDQKLGSSFRIHHDRFPDLHGVHFAIVGVDEFRRSTYRDLSDAPDAIRLKLYELYKPSDKLVGADLGNIKSGNTAEDTDTALKNVVATLVSNHIPVIVLGGTQELTLAMHKGYERLEVAVNHTVIDSRIDMGEFREPLSPDNYLSKVVLHDPSYLFSLSVLGYQSYYADPQQLDLMDKMFFDYVRLGELKADPSLAEPVLRNSDLVSFDMSAVRNDAAPGTNEPNGVDGELACKLLRYAGLSEKVSSMGIFNYNVADDQSGQQATLIAQMIWYFLEGLSGRVKEFPLVRRQNFLEYKVQLPEANEELVFYKSKRTDKWWIRIPYVVKGSTYSDRSHLMPCGYSDYQKASRGEMPELWWKTFQKLS
jgi:arginase family enzyme